MDKVYDILLGWIEHRDWQQALYAVIPQRKFKFSRDDGQAHAPDDAEPDAEEPEEDHAAEAEADQNEDHSEE